MDDSQRITAVRYVVEVVLAILLSLAVGGILLFVVPHYEAQFVAQQIPVPQITHHLLSVAHFLGTHWMHVLLPLLLLLAECFAHGRVGAVVRLVVITLMLAALAVILVALALPMQAAPGGAQPGAGGTLGGA